MRPVALLGVVVATLLLAGGGMSPAHAGGVTAGVGAGVGTAHGSSAPSRATRVPGVLGAATSLCPRSGRARRPAPAGASIAWSHRQAPPPALEASRERDACRRRETSGVFYDANAPPPSVLVDGRHA